MTEINFLSIDDALKEMRDGTLSPQLLTEACFRQIEQLNPALNAFITVCDQARIETRESENSHLLSSPLFSIPFAIKDLFETKGIRTTAGSLFLKDYVPDEDAFVIDKLKTAGAVIMGKANTHEIALGVTTVNPHYGATRNPWDANRIAGGSSGGSAVAVASGMSFAALGTDTGGSIRIPASLCGVVGLKPTYGRVSLRGVFPLSWNLDHVGPLTRTVKDAALVLQVIAGYDADDPSSINVKVNDYLGQIDDPIKGKRIAWAVGAYIEGSDAEVLSAVNEAANIFMSLGANVEKVEMVFLSDAALANGLMTQSDGAAYHRERLTQHPDWFGADVRQRLEAGRATTSTEYSLARHTQTEMKHRLAKLFEEYDFILLPTTPITAPFIEGNDAVEQARRLTRFTAPFNLTGLPAISIPCGFDKQGLPIGLQIVSRSWNEAGVLQAARAYERETNGETRHPPIVEK
jgi:aspartyl-tRNA(Asn)/glutamyl-tRNA(Gln) amidotransferase subunit A